MENKTLIDQQRELLLRLREAVNSAEEYFAIASELAELGSGAGSAAGIVVTICAGGPAHD